MNFDYLAKFPQMKKLHTYCTEAEDFALTRPGISATSARKAMEFVVKMIYASLLGQDYGLTVFEMIRDVRFEKYVGDPTVINALHYIRKMGNVAVHEGEITADEALEVLEELHFVVGEFAILLGLVRDYPKFAKPSLAAAPPATPANLAEKVQISDELLAEFAERMRKTKFQVHRERDEEENKRLFLKASLREAGWPMVNRDNQAMPCAAGLNILLGNGEKADYVLYGRDNRPLAVIEYTTTSQNLIEGRTRGIEKANALAVKYGYKPVVYYTNGYYIFVIDQLGYKPRRVFQFHSIEELELLKLRAGSRQDIRQPQIDEAIAGRDYQKQAITAACNAFADMRRGALLVMATGTGKTRVSIALADVLLKAGWAKNILFLADRTSLVRQAHKNFTKLLPNVTTSVYSGGSMNRDPNARIIFATYQTMIGLIEDDTREFGIGRFDLIIIDEAHRSIFNKYAVLFTYFDSLLLGLTATPRLEDNKSTYRAFGLRDSEPDFAYELEQAIDDGYLVGFSVQDKTTDALRRGVHYDELSEEDKAIFEDTFANNEEQADFAGTVIEGSKLQSRKYINTGTIDAMLNDLMQNGLKVDGGDSLGKTIIFAAIHPQAEKIVERFQTIYGRLGMDYCKLIDSQVQDSLSLIDNFEVRGGMPQIAVSVDMLDTGIDVPDVLNLVFFKQVKSKIKFLQMIGRGTRLSPDIFGPGEDKQGFLIFDYYDNFSFFRTRHTWAVIDDMRKNKSFNMTPQSILINQKKLNILCELIEKNDKTPFEEQYKNELKTYFITAVQGLCNDDIMVQSNMAYVSKYRTAEKWDGFTAEKLVEIEDFILPLLPPAPGSMKMKTFDLMMYVVEDEVPKRMAEDKDIRKIRHGFGNVGKKIGAMMDELSKLKTIPAVLEKEQLIAQMHNADLLFEDFSLEKCERVRLKLRDLMQYIPDKSQVYILHSDDMVIESGTLQGMEHEKSYAEKVQEYIVAGSPELAKIRNLDELTEAEKNELEQVFTAKLGSATDYAAWAGNKSLLVTLRAQVGIADEALKIKFGGFLNTDVLNNEQLEYMRQIISYARENGDITFMDLQRVSPLCDVDIMELFGADVIHVKTLINGLHRPVM